MLHKKPSRRVLVTDSDTDMGLALLVNEKKVNEQMMSELDEGYKKKLNVASPRLEGGRTEKASARKRTDKDAPERRTEKAPLRQTDKAPDRRMEKPQSRPEKASEKKPKKEYVFASETSEETELPSTSGPSSSKPKRTSTQSSVSESSVSSTSTSSSMYGRRVSSSGRSDSESRVRNEDAFASPLIKGKVQRNVETAEERRARARDIHAKLYDMVKDSKGTIVLSRDFTVDDDPDLMQEEYDLHFNRRKKLGKIKFYKNILFTGVQGIEFLNENYNPFRFKLGGWSQHMAADQDEYTEILEELYEKYKAKGAGFPPELRLIFAVTMSGVSYHISQALFGGDSLKDTVKGNPSLVGEIMKGVTGGITKSKESNHTAHAPNDISFAEKIRRSREAAQARAAETAAPSPTRPATPPVADDVRLMREMMETERKQIAEQKEALEEQARRQNEMYAARLREIEREDARRRAERSASETRSVALSDTNLRPRYLSNPRINPNRDATPTFQVKTDVGSIFEDQVSPTPTRKASTKTPSKTLSQKAAVTPRFSLRQTDFEVDELDLDEFLQSIDDDEDHPTKESSIFEPSVVKSSSLFDDPSDEPKASARKEKAVKPSPTPKKSTRSSRHTDYASTAKTPGGSSRKGTMRI